MSRNGKNRGVYQKKSLGQVFLQRDEPLYATVDLLRERSVETVFEIGPGGGALTEKLLEADFKVIAIEKDERFAADLKVKYGAAPLNVIEGDVLEFDFSEIVSPLEKTAIVGNIPYYISSPILKLVLTQLPHHEIAILLTQKEFAERCMSDSGRKSYGSFSVHAQLRADMSKMMDVPNSWFFPVPKIDSILWSLESKTIEDDFLGSKLEQRVESMCMHVFKQRRKMLSNSLKPWVGNITPEEFEKRMQKASFSLDQRPESLSPRQFVELAKILSQTSN